MTSLIIILPVASFYAKPTQIVNQYGNIIPDSAQHRIHIWHFVAQHAAERPFLGYGINNSEHIKKQYSWATGPEKNLLPSHPHNIILQIWIELGIIGL